MKPTAAFGIVVAALMATSGTGTASSDDRRAYELVAHLTPSALPHRPFDVRSGAKGTFRASLWPFKDDWLQARLYLAAERLTGPVHQAHIHTGTPGRDGPVLLTLCTRGRCNLYGGFRAYPTALVLTIKALGAYVDVHTKRNPRGELRGQIEIRRYGS
jgi:hypothetical protein